MDPRRTLPALALLAAVLAVAPGRASADPAPPAADAKDEAKRRFERGVELMNQKLWDEALAEFRASRALFPTRGNTQNSAVCLREVGRFDEALDMFDALLKEFATLSADERADVAAEIKALRDHVGSVEILVIEPGARLVIDGRDRGETPFSAPLRVNVGSHVVRVVKQGFAVLEARVEVRPRENAQVDGVLTALAVSGELKVTSDAPADVVVDGVVVGPAPWSGRVAVGPHAVALRAEGDRGTAPAAAPVKADETTALRLEVKALDAALRIEPTPANATVALDGVEIGRGVWEGRLPSGNHTIELAADGFIAAKRPLTLGAGKPEQLRVELERDSDHAMWKQKRLGRGVLGATAAPLFAPVFGGDALPGAGLGALATIHGGYELGLGVQFELEAGVAFLTTSAEGRAATLTPRGLEPNAGALDEDLRLVGPLVGGAIAYQTTNDWPFLARASGGVFFGQVRDVRSGTFTSNLDGRSYAVGPVGESKGALYGYVAPEVALGRRFGKLATLRLGVTGLFLVAPTAPAWADESVLLAGPCDGAGPCEGEATFGAEPLTASAIVAIAPRVSFELTF
ncbi:MAG: PEGA domain-containing protein [Polyangiaceae bacterium]